MSYQMMRCRILTSSLVLLSTAAAFTNALCQTRGLAETASEEGLMVRQLPDTEGKLRSYFNAVNLSDTIYAIMLPVGNCPRCESVLNSIYDELKASDPDKSVVMSAVYQDSTAADSYIGRYGLKYDMLLHDTDDRLYDFLSFSSGFFHIPYLLKVVPDTGELIIGVRAEDATPDFIWDFTRFNSPIGKRVFMKSIRAEQAFNAPDMILKEVATIALTTPDSMTLSDTDYQPEFYGNDLFINDKLREGIEYFRLNGDRMDFMSEIRTDSAQNMMFIDVPYEWYRPMVESKELKYMPETPKMSNDSTLLIAYSLPMVFRTGPHSLAYMNQSCVLRLNPHNDTASEIVPFTAPDDSIFFYPHFYIFPVRDDIVIGCKRMTWPMEYEKEEYVDVPEMNLFRDAFYDFPQPTVGIFSGKTGKLKGHGAQLPEISRRIKTGYAHVSPQIAVNNKLVAYSDGFSGDIYLKSIDEASPDLDLSDARKVKAFNIPEGMIPEPREELFYTYDCLAPYKGLFNRSIIDMRMTPDDVYCLIRYGDHAVPDPKKDEYSVVRINIESGEATESSFPIPNGRAMAYGLRTLNSEVQPYLLTRGIDGEWEVIIYKE